MLRTEIRQIIITVLLCIATAAAVLWIVNRNSKKIAVVDAVKLFNSYKMKLDLEAVDGRKLDFLAKRVDSLKQELAVKSKSPGIPKQELEQLYRVFQMEQANLETQYQQSNQSINEQVWKRLNPLVDEYAKKEGLRLIIGANGMGSVLYYDDFYDKTKEVIDYVNKDYEGR